METELTTDTDSKASWAKCQGYNYLAKSNEKDQKFNKLAARFAQLKECRIQLCVALHIDFLDCEKLLLPNVTLHIRLYSSPNNTIIYLKGTYDEAKAHNGNVLAIVEKASLFVRKVVVTDSVKLSIERALVKIDAMYPYIESLNKNIHYSSRVKMFHKGKCFWHRANSTINFVHG